MTPPELAALKLKLYREAIRAGTIRTCWRIGRGLGKPIPEEPHRVVTRWRDFVFLVNEREHYMCVWYRGVPVVLTKQNRWSFLPGPWEDSLPAMVARIPANTSPNGCRTSNATPP